MTRPKHHKLRAMAGAPMPASFARHAYKLVTIPNYDRPSVGTQPVFRVSNMPPCWLPDTEWARRWIEPDA